jgi:hypothetical protein
MRIWSSDLDPASLPSCVAEPNAVSTRSGGLALRGGVVVQVSSHVLAIVSRRNWQVFLADRRLLVFKKQRTSKDGALALSEIL